MQCLIHVKSQFQEKKIRFFPLRNVRLILPRNAIMLQLLIINFLCIICQVVAYERLKTKEHFKLLALKVVTVA